MDSNISLKEFLPGLPPFAVAETGQIKYKGPPLIFKNFFYSILRYNPIF